MNIKGLNSAQVNASRKKYGENKMPDPKLKSAWQFFIEVFKDKLNMILLVMMCMFIALSALGYGDIYEAIGIGIVLLVVTFTTVGTKLKSQRSAEELRKRTSLQFVSVLRNGVLKKVNSVEVVVDDIVIVQAGETICADGYMVEGAISVNNAILNGESDECEKSPVPHNYKYDRAAAITGDNYIDKHSVFAGTSVLSGEGKMRVTRVGTDTENAKIMMSLQSIDEVKTTLQLQLDSLAEIISKVGSLCAAIIFIVLMIVNLNSGDMTTNAGLLYIIFSCLTVALTIFVAAVPEGLPFIIGIITSQNVKTMIKNNILAKNPNKIPEAGNIQLLCTDKTGTLTRGYLWPVHNFTADGTDIGFDTTDGGKVKKLFVTNIALTNNSSYTSRGAVTGGNLTSRALFGALKKHAKEITKTQNDTRIMDRMVFNSANKFSATRVNKNLSYFMGAPEVILAHAKFYVDQNGATHKINKKKIQALLQENAARAMRLVATAYSSSWVTDNKLPDDLVFITLVAMRDEVREGVPQVVKSLTTSGVQVMMITGDIIDTARAIALDCGIMSKPDDIAVTAAELAEMSDTKAKKILHKIKVIARATPETKLRIVKLAQSQNKCIGMCGDGTNDAPALKRADVGFAMGDGTDVCKESSDIIITDNNFVSVANSILLGRTFVHNVINFLRFQLPINFALVTLSILFPLLFGFDAFTAVQILIINIVMDSLNSLAFGGEPARPEYLSEPAQPKNAPLLSWAVIRQIAWTTLGFIAVFALFEIPFVRAMFATPETYMSARFALLVIMAIFNGFCVRAVGYNLFAGLSKNPMFVLVAFGVIASTVACVMFGGEVLQLAPLDWSQWAIIFAMALMIIPLNAIRKMLTR